MALLCIGGILPPHRMHCSRRQDATDTPIYLGVGAYWSDEVIRVAAYDPQRHALTLAAPHNYGIMGGTWGAAKRRFFAMNTLEESHHYSYAYLLKHVAAESSFGICSSHCISFDSLFDFVENFLLHGLVGEAGRQRSDGF